MMTYLIICIALLIVIAPIFAILPTARQKEQMELRRSAMSEGVSVELTRIQDPIPRQDKYLSNTGKPLPPVLSLVAYRKVRPKPNQWRIAPCIEWTLEKQEIPSVSLPGTWHWVPAKPLEMSDEFGLFLSAQLELLPPDVIKIEEKNHFVSVYWHESSGSEGLSLIVRFLNACTVQSPYKKMDDDGLD